MGPLDALYHLVNFFLPALGVAALAAALAKLLWWRELRSAAWLRLARWGAAGGSLALLGGLVVFGRDGKMASYAAMVAATALALLWAGWRSPR
jgi:mevalonate pyrophosphate decarboxylase